MPLSPSKDLPKSSRVTKKRNKFSTEKTIATNMPKKVLISKKWHSNCSHEVKTKSDGLIECKKQKEKPNKTSSSLPAVSKHSDIIDFCRTCGDTDNIETAVSVFNAVGSSTSKTSAVSSKSKKEPKPDSRQVKVETEVVKEYYKNEKYADSKSTMGYSKKSHKSIKISTKKNKKELKHNKKGAEFVKNEEELVQEHYMNERFADLYDSAHDFDNIIREAPILDTITEVTEKQASTDSKSKSALESNVRIAESDDDFNLKRLKEFREKNYFECHSAKNRIHSKASVLSLKDHKCKYRLYLNDRLFPVAIDDDHNDSIRCVDCHLPFELANEENKANGTIQAKVKLGSETQDMVLLLPIKEPLIIKQKRKEDKNDEIIYFGLVRLDQYGDSIFNRSLPSDSLALRYQKGYRQFNEAQSYRYDKLEESDIVFV